MDFFLKLFKNLTLTLHSDYYELFIPKTLVQEEAPHWTQRLQEGVSHLLDGLAESFVSQDDQGESYVGRGVDHVLEYLRESHMALVAVVFSLFCFGSILFYRRLFGQRIHNDSQEPEEVEEEFAKEDQVQSVQNERAQGIQQPLDDDGNGLNPEGEEERSPLSHQISATILGERRNSPSRREDILRYISAARSSINLCLFGLDDDVLIGALLNKAAEGVHIVLATNKEKLKGLVEKCQRTENVSILALQARAWAFKYPIVQNFAIFDHSELVLTSCSWEKENLDHNHNVLLSFDQRFLVENASREFQKVVGAEESSITPDGHALVCQRPPSFSIVFSSGIPRAKKTDLRKHLLYYMKKAHHSICLCLTYLDEPRLIGELGRQSKRQIDIKLMVDCKHLGESARMRKNLRRIYKTTVKICLLDDCRSHLKMNFVIIDEKTCLILSCPVTVTCMTKRRSFVLVLHNIDQVEDFRKMFDRMWSENKDNSGSFLPKYDEFSDCIGNQLDASVM